MNDRRWEMRWALPAGQLFGTSIRIHLTFLFLLLWIAIVHYAEGGAAAAIRGTLFIIALFACVVLHEFGHILTARRYGVHTRDVILLPIGGVARMDELPRDPRQELAVAVAGPLVNFVIAGLLILAIGGWPAGGFGVLGDTSANFAAQLAIANLTIAVFNLLPAFPMDGGRALRALLAMRLGHDRATAAASRAGQVFAILFGFIGLLAANPILIFIALFIYLGAGTEAFAERMRSAAEHLQAREAAMTGLATMQPHQSVSAAADILLQGEQREIPVLDARGRFAGLITRDAIIKALREGDPGVPVGDAMLTNIPAVSATDPLLAAIEKMTAAETPAAAVTGPDGGYSGLITLENISELMLIRDAGRARRMGISSRD